MRPTTPSDCLDYLRTNLVLCFVHFVMFALTMTAVQQSKLVGSYC